MMWIARGPEDPVLSHIYFTRFKNALHLGM